MQGKETFTKGLKKPEETIKNNIKERQSLHSGPGAKPAVQSGSPDSSYSYATVNNNFYRKKNSLFYYCWEGQEEVNTC